MLRPAGATRANRLRISCFALPGEVSLYQADHVSSEDPAYSTHAGSAMHALPLTKLVSSYVVYPAGSLCLSSYSPPLTLSPKWCLCSWF